MDRIQIEKEVSEIKTMKQWDDLRMRVNRDTRSHKLTDIGLTSKRDNADIAICPSFTTKKIKQMIERSTPIPDELRESLLKMPGKRGEIQEVIKQPSPVAAEVSARPPVVSDQEIATFQKHLSNPKKVVVENHLEDQDVTIVIRMDKDPVSIEIHPGEPVGTRSDRDEDPRVEMPKTKAKFSLGGEMPLLRKQDMYGGQSDLRANIVFTQEVEI